MKEILSSNLLTKYIAGLTTKKENQDIESWLKMNPQFNSTLSLLKSNVEKAKFEFA